MIRCNCGRPAVWSGFCQAEDGNGYCPHAPAHMFAPGMRVRHADGWLGTVRLVVRPNFIRVDGEGGRGNYGDDACCFEPVDPVGAKPVEESDEQWLKRVVFELTGVDSGANTTHGKGVWYVGANGGGHPVFDALERIVAARDSAAIIGLIRARNSDHLAFTRPWPLKTPSDVGSAASSDGSAPPVSPGEVGAMEPTSGEAHLYGIPQPVEKPTCIECRAPMKPRPGREVCRYCDLRCGGYADPAPHAAMASREVAARQRLAAWELRSKPRVSPATKKMFEDGKAALRHWPSVEGDDDV